MARGFTVEIQGLQQLLNKNRNLPKKMEVEIEGELIDGGNRMVQGAVAAAPGDQGILRAEISSFKVGRLTISYVSGALHSGYQEFGTKSKVRVPAGLEQYAAEVKAQVNTTSLSAWEAISQWCKRQGIEQRLWWPIFRSIMVSGINPRPFFFPQVSRQMPIIIANIRKVLASLD